MAERRFGSIFELKFPCACGELLKESTAGLRGAVKRRAMRVRGGAIELGTKNVKCKMQKNKEKSLSV